MSTGLNILAFEPFFGGIRRSMLQTIQRHSRHHWILHTLPPRRMERRLAVAARWFAEKVTRDEVHNANVLFTSEAMNLADLLRSIPALAKKRSVVYFHDNRLATHAPLKHDPLELVDLNTAATATEAWFNSLFHLGQFLQRCEGVVRRHVELHNRDPMEQIAGKCIYVAPPVELATAAPDAAVPRDAREIFADLRDCDARALATALSHLKADGEEFRLTAIAEGGALGQAVDFTPIDPHDAAAVLAAIWRAGIFLSVRASASSDQLLLQGLAAGCWPIVPETGCYPEIIPAIIQLTSLHDSTAEGLAVRLMEARNADRPDGYTQAIWEKLKPFDAIVACREIDQRLENLAGGI